MKKSIGLAAMAVIVLCMSQAEAKTKVIGNECDPQTGCCHTITQDDHGHIGTGPEQCPIK